MMDKSKLMQERVVYQSKTSNMPLLYQILGITGRAIWPVIFYIAIYFIWTRVFNIRYMHPDDVKAVKVVAIVLLVGVIYLVIKQIIVALDTVSSYQRFDFIITTSRIIFFDIDRMQEQNLDIQKISNVAINASSRQYNYATICFSVGSEEYNIYDVLDPQYVVDIFYKVKEKVKLGDQLQNAYINDVLTHQSETNQAILKMGEAMEKIAATQQKILESK